YRHVNRRQLSPTGERTLINTIVPPAVGHINTVLSVSIDRYDDLLILSGLASSIMGDFFIKSAGKGDLYADTLERLPLPLDDALNPLIVARVLRLNCVTAHYAQLWTDLFAEPFREDRFAKSDRRLQPWTGLTSTWYPGCALRTDFERRQALVEL